MEKFEEALSKAKKNIQLADHMVYITYNVVNDPKLMLVILENVFLALTNAMSSVLYHDRLYKKIPPFHDSFGPKLDLFKKRYSGKSGIKEEHLDLLKDVKEIIIAHNRSPIEFRRKDSFVICSSDYKTKTISIQNIKDYIYKTKEFIILTERILKDG